MTLTIGKAEDMQRVFLRTLGRGSATSPFSSGVKGRIQVVGAFNRVLHAKDLLEDMMKKHPL